MRRSPMVLGLAVAVVLIAGAAGLYGFATLFLHPAPSAVSLDPSASQPAARVGPASLGSFPIDAAGWLADGSRLTADGAGCRKSVAKP